MMETLDKQLVEGVMDYVDAAGRRWTYKESLGLLICSEIMVLQHKVFRYVSIPGLKPLVEKKKCPYRHDVENNLFIKKKDGDWSYFCECCKEQVEKPKDEKFDWKDHEFPRGGDGPILSEKPSCAEPSPKKQTRTVTFWAWVSPYGVLSHVDMNKVDKRDLAEFKRIQEFDMTCEVTCE